MKKALVYGITGQDGSYIAEILVRMGYQVHGVVRRSSSFNTWRIDHLHKDAIENSTEKLVLHYGDLLDPINTMRIISKVSPDLIFNLAAQSHVQISFETPAYTQLVNFNGVQNILEAMSSLKNDVTLYQAGTSEMFGNRKAPQSDKTQFDPESPYAISKVAAHDLVSLYRRSNGISAVNGILFNHESFRRGDNFVTKKIVNEAFRIRGEIDSGVENIRKSLFGNTEAIRDWGWAPEYCLAIVQLMLEEHNDIVIGTGRSAKVKEFMSRAFKNFNLDYEDWVDMSESYLRPLEVNDLRADTEGMIQELGWSPLVHWEALCDKMCEEVASGHEARIDWKEMARERSIDLAFGSSA